MDSIQKAAFFAGKSDTSSRGAKYSTNVTSMTGLATSASSDGEVAVNLGGQTISGDGEQSIVIPSTVQVKEGDTVQISLSGADKSAKSIMVTGVVGGGDSMANDIVNAQTAASNAMTTAINGSVSDVQPEFYLSTSKTEPTGGSWSSTAPTYTSGSYYWTRNKITYADGSVAYSDPVMDSGLTSASSIAYATDQHFFTDTSGVHVTTGTGTTGKNILLNSNGVLIRNGSTPLASFDEDSTDFFDNGSAIANIEAVTNAQTKINSSTYYMDGATIGSRNTAYLQALSSSSSDATAAAIVAENSGVTAFVKAGVSDGQPELELGSTSNTNTYEGGIMGVGTLSKLIVNGEEAFDTEASQWTTGKDIYFGANHTCQIRVSLGHIIDLDLPDQGFVMNGSPSSDPHQIYISYDSSFDGGVRLKVDETTMGGVVTTRGDEDHKIEITWDGNEFCFWVDGTRQAQLKGSYIK